MISHMISFSYVITYYSHDAKILFVNSQGIFRHNGHNNFISNSVSNPTTECISDIRVISSVCLECDTTILYVIESVKPSLWPVCSPCVAVFRNGIICEEEPAIVVTWTFIRRHTLITLWRKTPRMHMWMSLKTLSRIVFFNYNYLYSRMLLQQLCENTHRGCNTTVKILLLHYHYNNSRDWNVLNLS